MSILLKAAAAFTATLLLAYGAGQFASRSIDTEIKINAPAAKVWSELTNQAAHAEWNPFIRHFSGDLAVGEQLQVTIQSKGNAPMELQAPNSDRRERSRTALDWSAWLARPL